MAVLDFLFTGRDRIPCKAAADGNGDGMLDISDSVSILGFLFLGGARPPAPHPSCGVEADPGPIPCAAFPPCG